MIFSFDNGTVRSLSRSVDTENPKWGLTPTVWPPSLRAHCYAPLLEKLPIVTTCLNFNFSLLSSTLTTLSRDAFVVKENDSFVTHAMTQKLRKLTLILS